MKSVRTFLRITHLAHRKSYLVIICPNSPLPFCTVLHRDTIVYRRGHRNLPARPSKMTCAAIETVVYIGHRKWPARPSKPTGAAIETYRRGHRKWPARPSKPTGAAIETYRPVILDGRAGHFRRPRRSFSMAAPVAAMAAPVAAIATHLCPYEAQ